MWPFILQAELSFSSGLSQQVYIEVGDDCGKSAIIPVSIINNITHDLVVDSVKNF